MTAPITQCTVCGVAAHATETDDAGVCASCREVLRSIGAVDVPPSDWERRVFDEVGGERHPVAGHDGPDGHPVAGHDGPREPRGRRVKLAAMDQINAHNVSDLRDASAVPWSRRRP